MRHLQLVRGVSESRQPATDPRVALARSILGHAHGHEQRAIREALAALDGASVEQIARARDEGADTP